MKRKITPHTVRKCEGITHTHCRPIQNFGKPIHTHTHTGEGGVSRIYSPVRVLATLVRGWGIYSSSSSNGNGGDDSGGLIMPGLYSCTEARERDRERAAELRLILDDGNGHLQRQDTQDTRAVLYVKSGPRSALLSTCLRARVCVPVCVYRCGYILYTEVWLDRRVYSSLMAAEKSDCNGLAVHR